MRISVCQKLLWSRPAQELVMKIWGDSRRSWESRLLWDSRDSSRTLDALEDLDESDSKKETTTLTRRIEWKMKKHP